MTYGSLTLFSITSALGNRRRSWAQHSGQTSMNVMSSSSTPQPWAATMSPEMPQSMVSTRILRRSGGSLARRRRSAASTAPADANDGRPERKVISSSSGAPSDSSRPRSPASRANSGEIASLQKRSSCTSANASVRSSWTRRVASASSAPRQRCGGTRTPTALRADCIATVFSTVQILPSARSGHCCHSGSRIGKTWTTSGRPSAS